MCEWVNHIQSTSGSAGLNGGEGGEYMYSLDHIRLQLLG